jgi:endonuclease/exonuclease/phosphatase family metal-dependent hydrolase
MQSLKIVSLNCEWMNQWFTSGSGPAAFVRTFKEDSHMNDTHQTAQRLAAEIRAVNPDILAIEEAPSRSVELQLFIETYLSDDKRPLYSFLLGDTGGAQKLGLLYKPDVVSAELAHHSEIKDLIDAWEADVDGNELLEMYDFTRLPLVVNASIGSDQLQIIVLHTKSSFINQGKKLWDNLATRQQFIHEALVCRRRNSVEAMRIRSYIDQIMAQDPSRKIVVMGDFNCGPGMDYFEGRYLAHNSTDVLLGSAYQPEWMFKHAQHDVPVTDRFTAVFDDFVTGEKHKKLLLDHILISPGLINRAGLHYVHGSGAIHHMEYETQVVHNGKYREDRPSDHRPVSVRLQN